MFNLKNQENEYELAVACVAESMIVRDKIVELINYIDQNEAVLERGPVYAFAIPIIAFAGLLFAHPIVAQDKINREQLITIISLIRQINNNNPRESIKTPEDLANFLIENAPEEMKETIKADCFGPNGAVEFVKNLENK